MITLFDENIYMENRASSKGNQLKGRVGNVWYKADYTGYEGLTEYVVSQLLTFSNLDASEYVTYETEKIQYKKQTWNGCKSFHFLKDGQQLITLERLFQHAYNESFYKNVFNIQGVESRIQFIVEEIERLTQIKEFGIYLSKLLFTDAVFLNEDRHMHNIAVIMNANGTFQTAPIFDNGAGLLSDTTIDYPMGNDIYDLIKTVKGKTVCENFDEALDAVEKLYGAPVKLHFSYNELEKICERDQCYDAETKERVKQIVMEQRRKYLN